MTRQDEMLPVLPISDPNTSPTGTSRLRTCSLNPKPVSLWWYRVLWFAPMLFLWQQLILHLCLEWSLNPQYRYGWAVPFLCGYLWWRTVRRYSPVRQNVEVRRPCPGSIQRFVQKHARSLGFALAVAYLPIRLVQEANPEWRLVSWVLAIEVIGFTVLALDCLRRCSHRSWFQFPTGLCASFPFLFFLLSVPWPTMIEGPVVRGMANVTAHGSVELLGVMGIPIVLHGYVLETASGSVGIDEACSGVRSLQACLMIAIFFGEVYRLSSLPRVLCVMGGWLFALSFNMLRTTLLLLIVAAKGSQALDIWHDVAGFTIPFGCLTATWLFALYLHRREASRCPPHGASGLLPEVHESVDSSDREPWPRWRLALVFSCWIAFNECGTELWYRAHEQDGQRSVRWHVEPPTSRNRYRVLAFSKPSRQLLRFDEGLNAAWEDAGRLRWQAVFLRWNPGHIAARLARNHTPQDCLIAAGNQLTTDATLRFIQVAGLNLPFRFYSARKDGDSFYVFYCLWEDRAVQQGFNEELLSYRNRLASVAAGRRNCGQRSLELALWGAGDDREAERALRNLLPDLIQLEH